MRSGMNFTNHNFWENLANSPFVALEFFSFLRFCIITVGVLIFEYQRYNPKKPQNITS